MAQTNQKGLVLTRSEVAAVMDYIWQHARGSPNGKAYKVWRKMFEFHIKAELPSEKPQAKLF